MDDLGKEHTGQSDGKISEDTDEMGRARLKN